MNPREPHPYPSTLQRGEPYQAHPANRTDAWWLVGGFVGAVLFILAACVVLDWGIRWVASW